MEIDADTLTEWAEDESFKDFKLDIEKINKRRPHVLSDKEEKLLAEAGEVLSTPTSTYMMFNNADLTFDKAKDKDGKEYSVTQGTFVDLLKSSDRELRKSAYENLYSAYQGFENTMSKTLEGVVNAHIFTSNAR